MRAPLARADLLRTVAVGTAVAAAGIPLGLLAAALTPRVGMFLYRNAAQGYPHTLLLQNAEEDRAAIGGDGVLLAVLAGAGLLIGLLALLARRRAPLPTVLGVLAGGLLAGVIAMAVAHVVVHADYAAVPSASLNTGRVFELRPYVRGRVDFVALPAVALLVFVVGHARWLWRYRGAVSSATGPPG